MTNDNRLWRELALSVQEVVFERFRGKGVAVVNLSLVIVDGELSCFSDPRIKSFGPFTRTRDLANSIAAMEDAID